MSFLDEVEELKRKAPMGRLPKPAYVGIAIMALLVLVVASAGFLQAGGSAFVIESSEGLSLADAEQEGAQDAERDAASAGGEDVEAQGAAAADAVSAAGAEGAKDAVEAQEAGCYVYVVGAVEHAGVYRLPAGARVNDAIAAAGGFAADAVPAAVNLAREVQDGEQITIPTQEQLDAGELALGEGAYGDALALGGAASSASGGISADGKVNLNEATAEELQTLNGIGEVTARKIIASREQEGPFATPDDLKRVAGIGEKKYAAIAADITV